MNKKQEAQIKQQILHHFVEIIELFPQYTIAQHMVHVLRPASEAYDFSLEELLKKFEDYRDELETELADRMQEGE